MNLLGLKQIKFWGASTSSHQFEGKNHNQWTVWELANATQLAAQAEQKYGDWLATWPEIKNQAQSPENYVSGIATDFFERYEEDFDLAQSLNMNALRISIEWSRIQPSIGQFDEVAINHYRQMLSALKKRGIEPIVTLWHWTNPLWFEEMGGFTKKANLDYFLKYVEKIIVELGEKIEYILTINEPQNYAWFSYGAGEWPPQEKSIVKVIKVMWNLAEAHNRSYDVIKNVLKTLKVGSSVSLTSNEPYKAKNPIHKLAAKFDDYANNWWYLDRTEAKHDFIGVNYYFKNYATRPTPGGVRNPDEPQNDLGWYMEPAAISEVLIKTHKRYNKIMMVTENGLADAKDQHRQWWLEETMKSLNRAITQDAKLLGYLHWSLTDNFEWSHGYWPRFGLIEIDRATLARRVRPSAKWLAEFIRTVR